MDSDAPSAASLPSASSLKSPLRPEVETFDPSEATTHPDPIPWSRLFPALMVRMADAVMYFCIFPFITEYITSLNVPPSLIGLYVGMAEGTLMLVEAAVATFWAKIADRYGRKKAAIWGFLPAVVSVSMIGFGKTVLWIIFWRGMVGFNSSGVVMKLLCVEMVQSTQRTKVLSIYSPTYPVGQMIGSLLGGELVHPYGRLPAWLGGNMSVWDEYPYALPCVFSAIIGIIAIVLCANNLEETRPPSPSNLNDDDRSLDIRSAISACFQVHNAKLILLMFLAFQFTMFGADGLFTVFTYTPVERGGLGLPVEAIGFVFLISMMMYIVAAPFGVPFIQNHLGTRYGLLLAFFAFPIEALLIPIAQFVAVRSVVGKWMVLLLLIATRSVTGFGWPLCDNLLFRTFEDYPELTATASALQMMAGGAGRAFGPSILGWIYSSSTQYSAGTFGRQISWMTLLLVSLPPIVLTIRLPPESQDRALEDGYETVPMLEESGEYDAEGRSR